MVILGLLVSASIARADDVDDNPPPYQPPSHDHYSPAVPRDRWSTPASINMIAAAGSRAFGKILAAELDYAPLRWGYVSALAGMDLDGWIAGGGLHARAVLTDSIALSIGGSVLHTSARTDTRNADFITVLTPTIINTYDFNEANWLACELALEHRSQAGVIFRLFGGVDGAVSGGDWKRSSVNEDNGLFGSHVPSTTMSSGKSESGAFFGVSVGYAP
jgi:hypothetical protein